MEITFTNKRGRCCGEFTDASGATHLIQDGVRVSVPRLWLGVMSFDQDMVASLLPLLQCFVQFGTIDVAAVEASNDAMSKAADGGMPSIEATGGTMGPIEGFVIFDEGEDMAPAAVNARRDAARTAAARRTIPALTARQGAEEVTHYLIDGSVHLPLSQANADALRAADLIYDGSKPLACHFTNSLLESVGHKYKRALAYVEGFLEGRDTVDPDFAEIEPYVIANGTLHLSAFGRKKLAERETLAAMDAAEPGTIWPLDAGATPDPVAEGIDQLTDGSGILQPHDNWGGPERPERDRRTPEEAVARHANGAPMFALDGTMLDDRGFRSIFDDVDQGADDRPVIHAEPSEERGRTDEEIVKQTNELARMCLGWMGPTGYEVPDGFTFWNAKDSRSIKAWKFACEIQEFMTATDPNDALSAIEDA